MALGRRSSRRGRARPDIRKNRTDVKLDGIWGGDASYPGKPSWLGVESCDQRYKTKPNRRTRSGEGAEGGRFTGSTYDSGPRKPGNRVEDKTLTTRKITGKGRREGTENPPLATVNTQLSLKCGLT